MRQQRPRADGFYGDTTFFLQRHLPALACVRRAAGAGERQARDSIGEPLDGRGAGQHTVAGVQPGGRLLENLTQGMDVASEPLDGRGAGQHTVAGVQPGGRLLENLTQGMDVATARLPVFRLREKLTDGEVWVHVS